MVVRLPAAAAVPGPSSLLTISTAVACLRLPQFLGACTKKEPYILVTELMSGGSLADAFRRPQVSTCLLPKRVGRLVHRGRSAFRLANSNDVLSARMHSVCASLEAVAHFYQC